MRFTVRTDHRFAAAPGRTPENGPRSRQAEAVFGRRSRRVPVRAARLTDEPALVGARNQALQELRTAIANSSRSPGRPPG